MPESGEKALRIGRVGRERPLEESTQAGTSPLYLRMCFLEGAG